MTKPIIRIHNIETDEVIDREMTDDEFAQYQATEAAELKRKAEAEALAALRSAAEAKLAALGLNADDLKALGL